MTFDFEVAELRASLTVSAPAPLMAGRASPPMIIGAMKKLALLTKPASRKRPATGAPFDQQAMQCRDGATP